MAAKTSKETAQHSAADQAAKNISEIRSRRQFTESNELHRQIKLLVAGCMPWGKDKARSALRLLRSGVNNFREMLTRIRVPAPVQMTAFLALSVAVAIVATSNLGSTPGSTVILADDEVEMIADPVVVEDVTAASEAVVETAEQDVSQTAGYECTLEDSTVSYSNGPTERNDAAHQGPVAHGYALYVEGQFIGATQTEGALEELLTQVAAAYRNENTVSISFVERVQIVECELPVESFTNLADIALTLNSTKAGEVTYTVQKGDCWSVIAQDHDMTNKELLVLNPGYDIDKLQIGDVLIISNAVPFLTVVVTQMEYYVAEVPCDIEYIDDSSMWVGDTAIVSKGANGTANTSALVTYQGTTEIKREIVEQIVITEPVTQVERRGTTPRPSWAPTGTFRWPTHGRLSSKFGNRYIFGKYSFHGGIDIANSSGTDIVAADGGIVTYSGWNSGGYGNLIIIDHQNGYKTYYAHCSKLLVSVGDKVHKGQHIAEMGTTGRSTGNHLHFEVRYKNERKNPLNYLPER